MKKVLLILLFPSFLLVNNACKETSNLEPAAGNTPIDLNTSLTSDFSTNLFKAVISNEPANANVIISPISVSQVLQMILAGANGNTADEIVNAFGDDLSADELIAQGKNVNQWLNTRKGNPIIELSNSVFYDKNSVNLLSDYKTNLQENFDASLFGEDFGDAENSLSIINSWVNDKTKGRITSILEEISPDEVMFLVNSLYLKADWKDGFAEEGTRDRDFTLQNGAVVQTPTMSADRVFSTYSDKELVAVELPYKDEEISMYLIKSENGVVNELISSFDYDKFKKMKEGLAQKRLIFTMPKFKVEYKNEDVKSALQLLGIKTAFTSGADLSSIAEEKNLALSRVVHKTYMTVDERGTEGAAVTAAGVVLTNMPPVVDFNSPFIFVLADSKADHILFMGRISDPR
jgi:serpin B